MSSEVKRLFEETEDGVFQYLEEAHKGLNYLLQLLHDKHKGEEDTWV